MTVKRKASLKLKPSACAWLLAPLALVTLAACGGGSGGSEATSSAAAQPSTPVDSSAAAASGVDTSVALAASAPASEAASATAKAAAAMAAGHEGATPPKTTSPTAQTGSGTSTATSGAPTVNIVTGGNTSSTTGTTGSTGATASPQASPSGETSAQTGSMSANSSNASKGTGAPTAVTVPVPLVFNAPRSSQPGDVILLQGENFGTSPTVQLVNSSGQLISRLTPSGKVGTGALTVKLPTTATGALIVQVDSGSAVSSPVKLNVARPFHLDAMQIAAKGSFRIFGRSLLSGSIAPTVTVDGLAATVDVKNSNEHMLVAIAPAALKANAKSRIVVDNNNGTGPATLDRDIEAVTGDGSDPYGLGVGWATAFSSLSTKIVNAATDPRISPRAACDGKTDDSAALQAAVSLVAKNGGGVVQLPAGNCYYTRGIDLQSRVVLKGAGKSATTLSYQAANPGANGISARSLELVGVMDLGYVNLRGASVESPAFSGNKRAFIKNVKFQLAGGVQMFLASNTNFAVSGSDIVQPTNANLSGPLVLTGNAGMSFVGNTITFAHGGPTMARTSDAYLAGNRISRDINKNQDTQNIVHSLAMDFAHRVAIVGNTFDVLGGPVTNKQRNDGETLLTEGGAGARTENIGTVTSATATTLTDTANTLNVNPFGTGQIPENYGVAIVSGKGAGQNRRVTAYSGKTLTVDAAWDVVPDSTSRYATFVWGLEKSLIKGNTLKDNPRGIWIYQTAARDIDIVENIIIEGGGIYVRTGQRISSKLFTPVFGLRIVKNTITNTTRQWPSYLNVNFTRMDQTDFGYSVIGTEIRQNQIVANNPNLLMPQEVRLGSEGYDVSMTTEGVTQALALDQVRLLGTVFQGNNCKSCGILIKSGSAAYGTAQDTNTLLN